MQGHQQREVIRSLLSIGSFSNMKKTMARETFEAVVKELQHELTQAGNALTVSQHAHSKVNQKLTEKIHRLQILDELNMLVMVSKLIRC